MLIESKRKYTIEFDLEKIRATQLYRTLLHEIGHYVQYCQYAHEDWEFSSYWKIPSPEKEAFAHAYANKLKHTLLAKNLLPFSRILNVDTFTECNLSTNDFIPIP